MRFRFPEYLIYIGRNNYLEEINYRKKKKYVKLTKEIK